MRSQKLYQKYSSGRHWEKHPTIYAEIFAEFLKSVNFKGLVVDIGSGNGRDVNTFSLFGFKSIGIDNSKKEINACKKKFPELKFEVQNTEKLKFKDNSIGAFFMINVIHYVNKEKAIKEIFRVLKPNGYFFIHFNIKIIDKSRKVDYYYTEKDILRLISKFKIVSKKVFGRIDLSPIKHKHKIMEVILQKL